MAILPIPGHTAMGPTLGDMSESAKVCGRVLLQHWEGKGFVLGRD